jgi:hypothetical protein
MGRRRGAINNQQILPQCPESRKENLLLKASGKAREDYPFKDPAKRGKGRPMGSVNRYTGALKELFPQAAEEVGDRTKIGPNGELDGNGGPRARPRRAFW